MEDSELEEILLENSEKVVEKYDEGVPGRDRVRLSILDGDVDVILEKSNQVLLDDDVEKGEVNAWIDILPSNWQGDMSRELLESEGVDIFSFVKEN